MSSFFGSQRTLLIRSEDLFKNYPVNVLLYGDKSSKINVVSPPFSRVNGPNSNSNYVVVHVSDHNPVMVAQVDYYTS